MIAPSRYLEAAKLEELAQGLEAEGYNVAKEVSDGEVVYDLVASKNGRKIVYEVTAGSEQGEAARSIRQRRERAHERGYDEFRLVVVNPPQERVIEVAGLEEALFAYLSNHMPPELDALSSHTFLDGIGQVDIGAIVAMPTGIRVAGTGVVDVTLEYGAGESWDGVRTTTDFPFSFDMLLDHRLTVAEVYALKVDTARFYE